MSAETPSKILLGLEAARGLYEYTLGWLLATPLKQVMPHGDNHPVMVLPGLGTSDSSTRFMRDFMSDIGYTAYPWGLGHNLGPRGSLEKLLSTLAARVRYISDEHAGAKVTLIGWSLGGIYSREVAKLCPDRVRQVITMGTPFKGNLSGTNATLLYEILSKDKSHKDPALMERISVPPPVPFTSLYSKTDGVVHWKCSIEDPSPLTQNIEIPWASHMGLSHNPISLYILANLLHSVDGNWKPFSDY